MAEKLIKVTDDFWNIRGVFRLFGVLNIETQASLVRLQSGGFVLLDSYTFTGPTHHAILAQTRGGQAIEAVLNLHPFHTVHVRKTAEMFPNAQLFGTQRHHRLFPDLSWQEQWTESPAFAKRFANDFDFMVPRGVEFIPDDEHLHFASVLAFHRSSETLHVDDTLNWIPLPWGGRLVFHPTLKSVLEPRPGAAQEFRGWAEELITRCNQVRTVCTAHAGQAPLQDEPPGAIATRLRKALKRIEKTLVAHERN